MCPPNQVQQGYNEEDNDLFTLDFASIIDSRFYDSLTHGIPACGIPYNLDEYVLPPIETENQVGNDDSSSTTSSQDVDRRSVRDGTDENLKIPNGGVCLGDYESNLISSNTIEQPEFQILEDKYCQQQKECGKTFILNQHNILEDLMRQKALKEKQHLEKSGSLKNGGDGVTSVLGRATLELFKTKREPDEEEFTTTSNAYNIIPSVVEESQYETNQELVTEDEDQESGGKRRKLICKVCGDTASGFHYRVASCEACKAFFKRTVQGKIEYACPASGNCKISTRFRKACQACRFLQCIKSGMLKEGIRTDRKRGGRQKYFRRALPDQSLMYSMHPNGMSLEDNTLISSLKGCTMSADRLAMSLLKVETMTASQIWIVLAELFNRYIQDIIGGINGVVGFCDFSLEDKMSILRGSWMEVLTLKFVCICEEAEIDILKLAPNFSLNKSKAVECGMEEFFDLCQKARKRVDSFGGINPEQLLILQALILINSDNDIEQKKEHKELKDNLLSLLTKYSLSLSPSSPTSAMLHVQNLLLLLPCIKGSNIVMDGMWKELKGQIDPNNKLLIEMIGR